MIKTFIYSVVLMALCMSCNKDDGGPNIGACDVVDPLVNIDWLREQVFAFDVSMVASRQLISQYRYLDQDVFLVEPCYQCADGLSTLRNCEGVAICEFGGIDGRNTCPDFETNATLIGVLYDK